MYQDCDISRLFFWMWHDKLDWCYGEQQRNKRESYLNSWWKTQRGLVSCVPVGLFTLTASLLQLRDTSVKDGKEGLSTYTYWLIVHTNTQKCTFKDWAHCTGHWSIVELISWSSTWGTHMYLHTAIKVFSYHVPEPINRISIVLEANLILDTKQHKDPFACSSEAHFQIERIAA